MKRAIMAVIATAGIAVVLTGCSTISTEPDQVAIHYSGGSFSSKNFQSCVAAGTRDTNGPGDGYFVYPDAGSQRDFTADKSKADREADTITVTSSDNQEMAVPMVVTFTLNTSCEKIKVADREYPGGILQIFHERLGNKSHAYWNYDEEGEARSDGAPKGWVSLLQFSIGIPLDRAADRLARSYTVKDLWQNPAKRVEFETELNKDLAALVDQQMGAPVVDGKGQEHFFKNIKVSVGQPVPANESLRTAVSEEQAAIARANTAKQKAGADQAAAEAQIAVAQAQAKSMQAEIDALGPEVWAKKYAIDHNVNPYPAPIVAGGAPAAK